MTISITEILRTGSTSWQYTWAGDAGETLFDIWNSDTGQLLEELTRQTSITVENSDTVEPPALEIRGSFGRGVFRPRQRQAKTERFNPRPTIQFRGIVGVLGYRVEELVSSVWTFRRFITERGDGYYQWSSAAVADVTSAQFRVLTVENGDDTTYTSTALNFDFFMVRHPPPPSVTITWDDANDELDVVAR